MKLREIKNFHCIEIMKIGNINVFHANGGWIHDLVKISTSEGIIGWSECSDSHGSPKGIEGVINDLSAIINWRKSTKNK